MMTLGDAPEPLCPQCRQGLILLQTPAGVQHPFPGHVYPRAARCLCALGIIWSTQIPSIDRVEPAVDIRARWPEGPPPPAVKGSIEDQLDAAGILPACWSWTLDSYRKRFGKLTAMKGPIETASLWVRQPALRRSDLVILGAHGTGKTGLAIALLHELALARELVCYRQWEVLSMEWRDVYDREGHEERTHLDRLERPAVLVIDEVRDLTPWGERSVLLLLDRRQKWHRATILIANTVTDDRRQEAIPIFGTGAYDRLRERAQWIELAGQSRRGTRSAIAWDGLSHETAD